MNADDIRYKSPHLRAALSVIEVRPNDRRSFQEIISKMSESDQDRLLDLVASLEVKYNAEFAALNKPL